MNIDVLNHIVANDSGRIEELANEHKLESAASLGVAKAFLQIKATYLIYLQGRNTTTLTV